MRGSQEKAFIHLFIDFIDKDYKQQLIIIIINNNNNKNENMSSTTATSTYLKPDYLQPLNSTSFSSSSTSVCHLNNLLSYLNSLLLV
jgi:hypothetical protein